MSMVRPADVVFVALTVLVLAVVIADKVGRKGPAKETAEEPEKSSWTRTLVGPGGALRGYSVYELKSPAGVTYVVYEDGRGTLLLERR